MSENKTGELYALKVLKKDNVVKRNQVEHTRTERSVLGYVKHPFIVGMNMAFQSKDKLYFVLDYCPGGELFFHLGKLGKFPEARARFYTAEIILAISYVHSLDIVYRDLKPEVRMHVAAALSIANIQVQNLLFFRQWIHVHRMFYWMPMDTFD